MALVDLNNFRKFEPIIKFSEYVWATDIYVMEEKPVIFSSLKEKGVITAFREEYEKIKDKLTEEELWILKKGFVRADFEELLREVGIELNDKVKNADFSLILFDEKRKRLALFRANIGKALGNYVLTLRRLFHSVPPPPKLLVPNEVWSPVLNFNSGLVIIAGVTGSGKSTTLASILKQYNDPKLVKSPKVVITLEKPVEYILRSEYSTFIQREIPSDISSVIEGITNALRQNPDVIVVGEARTSEEIESTLIASETGHLTFMTLHTNSVGETIKRIVGSFSGNDEKRIRLMLASQLKMVIIQRLVKSKKDANIRGTPLNGRPVPVFEFLRIGDEIRQQFANLIREGKEDEIQKMLLEGRWGQFGANLNQSLAKYIEMGIIDTQEAFKVSYNIEHLKKLLTAIV
jgi:twitching motility protein PilT